MIAMEPIDLAKQFSYRLRDALLAAGFDSQRSPTGVCTLKLAEITGYSVQICRRYLRGKAIPDALKLREIAEKLEVSPGWLLFGEHERNNQKSRVINLSEELLHYLLIKNTALLKTAASTEAIAQFLVHLVADIDRMNVTDEQAKKIIDIAITSAHQFSQRSDP